MVKRSSLFLVAILCVWGSTIVGAQDQVAAPVYKEGDTWQFNISRKGQVGSATDQLEGNYELTVAPDNAIKIYELSGGDRVEAPVARAGGLLWLIGRSKQRSDLKFPLSVGQKWSYEYSFRPPAARQDQKRLVEVNVVGIEKVNTAAGAFDAYKLVKTESWSFTTRPGGAVQNAITVTYFFSPETKSIIKSSSTNENNAGTIETELTKFTAAN